MNFNATCFVQTFNFLITFWVIKRLFISPVLRVINSDHHYKQTLGHETAILHDTIAQLKAERDARWHEAQNVFAHEQPAAEKSADCVFHNIAPALDAITTTAAQRDEFIQACAQEVVERVEKSL